MSMTDSWRPRDVSFGSLLASAFQPGEAASLAPESPFSPRKFDSPINTPSPSFFLPLSPMAFSPGSSSSRAHRGRRSDIYSTVVIHGDGSDPEAGSPPEEEEEEEEEEDASSLPPLLQRVPKDFGAAIDDDDDEEEDSGLGFSGTVIVKRDARPSPSPTARRPLRSPFLDVQRASPRSRSDPDDAYSTFLIRSTARAGSPRESVSGTVVRRTPDGGGGGFGSSFMSGMVEGTRAGEPGGIGQFQLQWEEGRLQQQARRKASVSSVPDSVTKEDPSTKYELLHELGEFFGFFLER